ncbi:uncharacterized protein A1O9_06828 [Exophiala aquamarina CBS 119918]|uniref:Uncharacterized protein n=1 Tax=Exophiala aquamarina CBS 119918 TaxID=1182545 RepID=A0A072P936_9EURO|nr:uncharacterized protein A1O9_06828 [Exophiala aquamarina CBS 119918]KEF56639.1 hypothetical protein A1O9_06828 [Exophiala aquamarina CBS 119918]
MDLGSPIYELPAIKRVVSGRHYACAPRPTYPPNSVQELLFWDLSNDDSWFEPDLSRYLPSLKPKLGKFGVGRPSIIRKPLKWWKAQCGFRGLSTSGSLVHLQNRIRALGGQEMCPLLAAACAEMEEDYLTRNKDAIDKKWNLADDNEKAKLWPQRFLYESFLVPPAQEQVLVVEVDDWPYRFEKICGQMNIPCESRIVPFSDSMGLRKIAVGLDAEAVRSRYAELDREAKRLILRWRQEKEERHKKADEPFFEKLDLARTKTEEIQGEWDVGGKWIINCPYMEESWGSEGQKCSIEFEYTRPDAFGLGQLYGSFDFIALAGIMRIVDPNCQSRENLDGSSEREILSTEAKEKREEEQEGSADSDDKEKADEAQVQAEGEAIDPDQFIIPCTSLPSAKSRKFGFRWRGNETGEGEIQGGSEEDLCSITFENPNALSGIFISDLTGEQKFQGFREGFDVEATAVNRKRPYGADPSSLDFSDDIHKLIWFEGWPEK